MVITGLEKLASRPPAWFRNRRLGLLCNQASIDSRLDHSRHIINQCSGGMLRAVFSPQHGLFADRQDNMQESDHCTDPELGIPVFSLYGETREPDAAWLDEIDILIVDLQDVGCRVYTYIWTMLLCMKKCSQTGTAMAVLDRPNPVGGEKLEGNLLQDRFHSFVGLAPIPMRHGMTMGELALCFRDIMGMDMELEIVRMEGWNRKMYFPDTGLPWVWPSPNMPTFDTATVYPGQVILEGTNISEGRGTTRPFEVFGAPFLDMEALKKQLQRWKLPGFILRPQFFEPTFHKWAGEQCRGFQLHVTEPDRFDSYLFTLAMLSAINRMHSHDFQWKSPPYEYEFEKLPADLIIGNQQVRQAVEQGAPPAEMKNMWSSELQAFREERKKWLLYN